MARHRRVGLSAGLLLVTGGLTLALTGSSLFHTGPQPGDYFSPGAIAAEGHASPSGSPSVPPAPAHKPPHRADRSTPSSAASGQRAHVATGADSAARPSAIGQEAATAPATGQDKTAPSATRASTPTPDGPKARSGANPRAPRGAPSHVRVVSTSGATEVDTSLRPTYLDRQEFLVPAPGSAGWYAESGWPKPGYPGTSILVGHISWSDQPDVFWNLPRVRVGDTVAVTYSSGQEVRFRVTKSAPERKTSVPHDSSIWDAGNPEPLLRLITCDPATTFVDHHYLGNWVVWAVPA